MCCEIYSLISESKSCLMWIRFESISWLCYNRFLQLPLYARVIRLELRNVFACVKLNQFHGAFVSICVTVCKYYFLAHLESDSFTLSGTFYSLAYIVLTGLRSLYFCNFANSYLILKQMLHFLSLSCFIILKDSELYGNLRD